MLQLLFFAFHFVKVAHGVQVPSTDNLNSIYGRDDRSFVDKFSSPRVDELSKAVALIVSKDVVEKKFFYSHITAGLLNDVDGVNLCRDEKYAGHHTVNSCTGFLIADDLVASAGHCFMSASDCDNKLIIFNTRVSNETKEGYSVFNQKVYECSEIVSVNFNTDEFKDYAVIRLKKKVFGVKPLKLRRSGLISSNDQVFMIGHPMGLPLIATNNAMVNDISNPHFFKATLDSFEGNSGSPVFNSKTFEVEGILVRGEEDFLQDEKDKCYRNEIYDEGTLKLPTTKGEGVSRISDILSFVK